MRVECLDRAQRQERAEPEGNIRRAPDFGAGGVDGERKALAAKRFGSGHRVPARSRPALVRIGPARGGGHLVGLEVDPVLVPDTFVLRLSLSVTPIVILQ